MLKNIMAVAAVSGLALTSAMAQSTSPSTTSPTSPNTPSMTAPSTSPSVSPSTSPSNTAAATTTGKATFIHQQTADQHLASKFKGTDVIGADDAKIGDVSDILFDKDQKILAYIVGVGGFLGIGQKDVAIAPSSFQPVPGKDATDTKLRLSMTKDELKAAETFEPYKAPSSATSSNAPTTRPMGAPAPATPRGTGTVQ